VEFELQTSQEIARMMLCDLSSESVSFSGQWLLTGPFTSTGKSFQGVIFYFSPSPSVHLPSQRFGQKACFLSGIAVCYQHRQTVCS
jgi:hypothetical protein